MIDKELEKQLNRIEEHVVYHSNVLNKMESHMETDDVRNFVSNLIADILGDKITGD